MPYDAINKKILNSIELIGRSLRKRQKDVSAENQGPTQALKSPRKMKFKVLREQVSRNFNLSPKICFHKEINQYIKMKNEEAHKLLTTESSQIMTKNQSHVQLYL